MRKNKKKISNLKERKAMVLTSDKIEATNEDLKLKKFNLLTLLLSFEKYWSPYSLSDGSLYKEEVKEEAAKVVSLYCEIYDVSFYERSSNGDIIKPNDRIEQNIFIRSLKTG